MYSDSAVTIRNLLMWKFRKEPFDEVKQVQNSLPIVSVSPQAPLSEPEK